MWIICMTTDSDGYHMDMKFKRKFLYHFLPLKVIPQKTEFNIECLCPEDLEVKIQKMVLVKILVKKRWSL